jgi:pimeloyl-ACP methyl ester carboxylesterase
MITQRAGEYIDVAGVKTWHELRGTGDPLVLLHGGMCTAETFDAQAQALAETFAVHLPERRGHGRTPDVDGPITYAVMARDTLAYLDAAGLDSAHLVGWSDGAVVALLVALEAPERVRSLVLIGQFANFDGLTDEFRAMAEHMTADVLPAFLRDAYGAVSPDGPDHYDVVFEKLLPAWQQDPAIALDRLAGIACPALVLMGEHDILTVEHAAAMARAFGDGHLAVVPNATHGLPLEKPELTNRLLLDFLQAG